MKVSKKYLVLCLVLVCICIIGVNCVQVEVPQKNSTPEVVALGVSNGYVLLHHPNGKFYVVELQTHTVAEVADLPVIPNAMQTY